ncbi:hypothetical protein GLOIN_2v1708780 [Rhizophagus clarus]|uniref:Uncharacterized protein n=1 Tax=Rhizophagus clarus TaxID=94130 RepID=A0A8H3LGC5_9GLOM|nr:hypothetical protein GLOIN_2v1708780 [Rhizophagus clarus]
MSNTQSNDSLRELNAKLLAEIGELRKKFAEIKVENDELKDKNTEIPELRRKFAEIETERTELKAKIAELLKQGVEENKRRDAENAELKIRIEELEKNKADSSAENVRRDVEITEIKAEIVKLRDNNEENKELTFLQSDNISKEMVSGNGKNNNTIDSNNNTMNSNTSEAPFGNIQVSDSVVDQLNNEVGRAVTSGDAPSDNANTESLEDKETDGFLDEVHKKKISDEIRERKREEKLHRESIAQDSLISRNIKTVPSGNDQSHVTSKTEVSVEQDDDMIPGESLDENQIVEQGLIHELCSSISPEDNVSSTEIISSCVSLENLISGSAQHLSYLFETAIKSSQQEILDWYNYSFEFESKVDALMADGRIKDKTARSMIYKEMKPFLPTKITQANLRKKTHRARKHLMLFGENGIGLDKIKLVSYSATEISKLTNAQIQNVIDQVKKYTSDHQSHMTLIKTVPSGNDQIKAERM